MNLPFVDWIIPTKKTDYQPRLLRKGAFCIYTVLILLVNMFSGALGTPVSAGAVSASELITLCNQERQAAGLNALSQDSRLVSAAHGKAENMFDEQYWDHYGPNGETPWQFILAAGYNYVYAGENLAKGFTTSEGVHSAWMASESHRENIMSPNYRNIGIAAVPGTLLGENVILVVQMFGATSVLPETSETNGDSDTQDDSQPQPSTTPEPVQEPIDDSLEITYPEDGDFINENDFSLEGTSGVSEQDIEIFNDEALLGDAVCEEGVWDYRPEEKWDEDEYDVHAEGSIAGVSDSVGFTVDTVPPEFDKESLEITYEVGILVVRVELMEEPAGVSLTVGDKRVDLEKSEEGYYEGSLLVTSGDTLGECEIVASDTSGNYASLGIANEVRALVSSSEDGGFSLGSLSSIFNKAIIVGLAILFGLDIYYLYKLKKLESHGKTLFKTSLWVIILGVTLLIGATGTIS